MNAIGFCNKGTPARAAAGLALLLALAFALLLALAPAFASGSRGYWALNEAPDGVKAGVIFPDFSPNEFAGLSLLCTPGTASVAVSVDVAARLRKGAPVEVTIRADDNASAYRARAEISEMDDSVRAVFDTTLADPMLTDLANAGKLGVTVGRGKARELPVRGAAGVLADFLARCRK
jgi:hypothetical protein